MQPSPFWATNEKNRVETSLAGRAPFLQRWSRAAKAVPSAVYLLQLGLTIESVHSMESESCPWSNAIPASIEFRRVSLSKSDRSSTLVSSTEPV